MSPLLCPHSHRAAAVFAHGPRRGLLPGSVSRRHGLRRIGLPRWGLRGRWSRGLGLMAALGLDLILGTGAIAQTISLSPSLSQVQTPTAAEPQPDIQRTRPPLDGQPNSQGEEATSPRAEPKPPSSPGKLPNRFYSPIPLKSGIEVQDTLTTQDIPMGQGSFARDYVVQLEQGDQVVIDLVSESFDTVVTLMAANGTTLGENDDGPDGGTNSLLFMRIIQSGEYIVRVRGFGQAKGGPFKLKLTRLAPVR